MDAWWSLIDYRSEHQFDDCLKKFEIACLPWSMFVDYVNKTWIIPYKEKFVKVWTNKVIYLGNTTTKRYENVHIFLLGLKNSWILIIVFVYHFLCI